MFWLSQFFLSLRYSPLLIWQQQPGDVASTNGRIEFVSFVLMFSKIFCKNIKYSWFWLWLVFFWHFSVSFFNNSSCFLRVSNVCVCVYFYIFTISSRNVYRFGHSHKPKYSVPKLGGKEENCNQSYSRFWFWPIRMECTLNIKHRINN